MRTRRRPLAAALPLLLLAAATVSPLAAQSRHRVALSAGYGGIHTPDPSGNDRAADGGFTGSAAVLAALGRSVRLGGEGGFQVNRSRSDSDDSGGAFWAGPLVQVMLLPDAGVRPTFLAGLAWYTYTGSIGSDFDGLGGSAGVGVEGGRSTLGWMVQARYHLGLFDPVTDSDGIHGPVVSGGLTLAFGG